jgi:tyrosyl-tRNA synthetase
MSIPDALMLKYYTLLTDDPLDTIKAMHPRDAKVNLAKIIISRFYSQELARQAEEEFNRVFSEKQTPTDIPSIAVPAGTPLPDVLVEAGICKSKNEARRMIKQNAVEADGVKVTDEAYQVRAAATFKIGSRRFLKVDIRS